MIGLLGTKGADLLLETKIDGLPSISLRDGYEVVRLSLSLGAPVDECNKLDGPASPLLELRDENGRKVLALEQPLAG